MVEDLSSFHKLRTASTYQIFAAILTDVFLTISLVSIILGGVFKLKLIIYIIPSYLLEGSTYLGSLLWNYTGLDYLVVYLIIAFVYYLIESLTGISIGDIAMRLRLVRIVKDDDSRSSNSLMAAVSRASYMAFPPLFAAFYFLRSRKNGIPVEYVRFEKSKIRTVSRESEALKKASSQGVNALIGSVPLISEEEFHTYIGRTGWDKKTRREFLENLTGKRKLEKSMRLDAKRANEVSEALDSRKLLISSSIKERSDRKENRRYTLISRDSWTRTLYVSLLLYFVPMITEIIIGIMIHTSVFSTPAPISQNSITVTASQQYSIQKEIFSSNFNPDLNYFVLGGLTFSVLDYQGIFLNIYVPTLAVISSLNSVHWAYVIYGVLPHFFIETIGFCFGIASGLYITRAIFDSIDIYRKGESVSVLYKKGLYDLYLAGILFFLSFLLLLTASYVEAFITPYILNHYYF